MTQTSNRLLDEFAKMMTDAASVAQGAKREMETLFRSQAERFFGDMDLVKREEFEAVRAMAVKAREENDRLSARIAELEAALGGAKPAKAPRAKPAARKSEAGEPEAPSED